jgi:hypothetical protein
MKAIAFIQRLIIVSTIGLSSTSVAMPMAIAAMIKNTSLERVPNSSVRSANTLNQANRSRKKTGSTVTLAQSADPTNVQTALIQLRTFIPCQAVNIPIPGFSGGVFGGDNRGFTREFTSRVRSLQQAYVAITDSQVNTVKSPIYFGQTTRYDRDQGSPVRGKFDWCWQLKPNQAPKAVAQQTSTDRNNKLVINRVGENVQVIFYLDAKIPPTRLLEEITSSAVPAFNADISVLVRPRKSGGLEYLVLGTHDGFPAYELLINGNLVYTYDPIKAGKSPASLIPPSDQRVSIPWTKVPPYPTPYQVPNN